MTIIETALKYRAMGLSVIPQKNKHPILPWTEFQNRLPSEDEIKKWWTENPDAGISSVVGSISKVVVVDCDSQEAVEKFEEQIPDSVVVPTAQTPRGGRHYYFSSDKAYQKYVAIDDKTDFQAEGSVIVMPPSKGPNGTPYSWIVAPESPQDFPSIEVLNHDRGGVGGVYKKITLFKRDVVTTGVVSLTTDNYSSYKILQKGTRDNDLFKIGMALADGHAPTWMIAQVIEKLALSSDPPFPLSEAKIKFESVIKNIHRKRDSLMDEVREWCLLQKGYFFTTELQHELQITTKEEKKHLTVIMVRLQAEKIIEKYGEKRGCYRTIEKIGNLEMEFIEDEIKEFDIKLPFGLNKYCSIYPKNIIVVAGSKSSGKTALLMNIAMENQDKHEVVYFNSEMGTEEWSSRLRNMGIRKKEDVKIKAYGLHKNFQDMMDEGKKIYIIDYLEIHENFYEIAKHIRLIHEALKDGVCIIAVQKKRGELLARGGDFSMEKSRLYLNMEFMEDQRCTKMTIVDAKSPKIPASLSGWSKRIKIIGGAKMESLSKEWEV
jgi:hypothetical protein